MKPRLIVILLIFITLGFNGCSLSAPFPTNSTNSSSPSHLPKISSPASPYRLETESPNNRYKVLIEEGQALKHIGLDDIFISWKAFKNGQIVFDDLIDFRLPTSYSERHRNDLRFVPTRHEWMANNIFWIGGMTNEPKERRDELIISNETASEITTLAIVNNLYQVMLIFDLPSHSVFVTNKQPMALRGPNAPNFHVFGKLSDGTKIASRITEFPNFERYTGTLHFCLSIKGNQVSITCRELDGQYDTTNVSEARKKNAAYEPQFVTFPKGSCDTSTGNK